MDKSPRHRRVGRVIGWTAIALGAALCLIVPIASLALNGQRLGTFLTRVLPKTGIAGAIKVDSVTWRPRLLFDLLIDRPSPVVVEGLRFIDPEGVEVLFAPKVEVRVRPRSALGLKIVLSDLVVAKGARWRFAQQKNRPEIGFLATFDSRDPTPSQGDSGPSGFVFEITDAKFLGLDARFDFPEAWGLLLRDMEVPRASLLVALPFVGWSAPNLDVKGGGFLEVLGERLPWDRVKVRKVETTRARPDDIFLDVESAETGAARLTARGYFTRIYGYGVPKTAIPPPPGIDLRAELSDAAPAFAAVAAARGLKDLEVGGQGASASVELKGPFIELKLNGQARGLDLDYGGRVARDVSTTFFLDVGEPMHAEVKQLTFTGGSGGRFEFGGKLNGPAINARLALRQFGTASYLPESARSALAGRLEGGIAVSANLGKRALAIDNVDLRLDRDAPKAAKGAKGAKAGRPREQLRVLGRARATPEAASTEGLTIELPGATITAKGRYGLAHQMLGFALRATASELPRLLAIWGVPPLADSAVVELEVGGRLTNPEAHGAIRATGVTLGGLPRIDRVQAGLRLADGVARLEELRADAFGGLVTANGNVRLWNGTFLRPLRAPAFVAKLGGEGVELGKIVPAELLAGRVNLQAEAAGTPEEFQAKAVVPAGTPLSLLGEPWRIIGCELGADAAALSIRRFRLERAGGGIIELSGRAAWDGPVKVAVNVEGVPLDGLPGLARTNMPFEGRLSSHLDITGSWERPLIDGEVAFERVAVRGVTLGNGRIKLQPTEDGGVTAKGDLFGRISLGGQLSYAGGAPLITAKGEFRDVLLEQYIPELAGFGDARGRLSGTVDFSYGGANPLTVDLRLKELELSAERDLGAAPGERRAGRLSVRNGTPVRVILAGSHLIVDRTRLVTEGGDLKLWGEVKDDVVNGELQGVFDLELLQPLLGNNVDGLGGEVDLALRIRGTPQHPRGEGNLTIIRPIAVRLPGIASSIMVPTGAFKLDPTALTVANLAIEAEGAQLRIGGRARFGAKQDVEHLDFAATGDVSGALLEAVARGAIAEAGGRAQVDAHVEGSAAAPKVSGKVDLSSLSFRLLDFGRDVVVESGLVELVGMDVFIKNLRARVDGQGELLVGVAPEMAGRLKLTGSWPRPGLGAVRLPLRGQRLSIQASNAVELDDMGVDVDVSGDLERGLALDGEVTVASGRYVQDFKVTQVLITPSIDESDVKPFYADNPVLEKLALRVRLRTLGDTFVVQSNIAPELHLAFDLRVNGTLAQPRIAGEVRPTDGRFHLFGVRHVFDLVPNVNQITFVETKSLERGETPELNLEAEALVNDNYNREHAVHVRITGPLANAHIDLSTNTGLSRSQAFLLLLTGRTGDTDSAITGTGGGGNTSASTLGGGGSDVIGQLFADVLEPYIDESLQPILKGKVNLRPTLGPDGFELRLDARVGRQFDLRMSLLRGLETRRRYSVESSLWLMDYVTLRGLGEQTTFSPQEGLIEESNSLKLELSLDFPIRPLLR